MTMHQTIKTSTTIAMLTRSEAGGRPRGTHFVILCACILHFMNTHILLRTRTSIIFISFFPYLHPTSHIISRIVHPSIFSICPTFIVIYSSFKSNHHGVADNRTRAPLSHRRRVPRVDSLVLLFFSLHLSLLYIHEPVIAIGGFLHHLVSV